jgi:hypothetical protein
MWLDCLFVVYTGHMRYFVNAQSTVCSWTVSKFSEATRASNKRVKNSSTSKKVQIKYNTMYHFSFEVSLICSYESDPCIYMYGLLSDVVTGTDCIYVPISSDGT